MKGRRCGEYLISTLEIISFLGNYLAENEVTESPDEIKTFSSFCSPFRLFSFPCPNFSVLRKKWGHNVLPFLLFFTRNFLGLLPSQKPFFSPLFLSLWERMRPMSTVGQDKKYGARYFGESVRPHIGNVM